MLTLHHLNILTSLFFVVPQPNIFSVSSHISVISKILPLTFSAKQLEPEKEQFLTENLQL